MHAIGNRDWAVFAVTLSCVVALALNNTARAENTPASISFAGVLKDSSGNLVNATCNAVFRIYDVPSGGTALWGPETHALNIVDGVVVAQLGTAGSPLSHDDFSGHPRYLDVDLSACSITISSRIEISSNPYAFRTGTVDGADAGKVFGSFKVADETTGVAKVELGTSVDYDGGFMSLENDAGVTITMDGNGGASGVGLAGSLIFNKWVSGAATETVFMEGSKNGGGYLELNNSDGNATAKLFGAENSTDGSGALILRDSNGLYQSVLLDASDDRSGEDGGGLISVVNTGGDQTVIIDSDDHTDGSTYNGGGQVDVYNGNTYDNLLTVHIDGSDSENGYEGDGRIDLYDSSGFESIRLHSDRVASGPELSLFKVTNDFSVETIEMLGSEADDEAGQIVMRNLDGNRTIVLDGDADDYPGAGVIQVRDPDGNMGLRLNADRYADGPELSLFNHDGSTETVQIVGQETSGDEEGGEIKLRRGDDVLTVEIDAVHQVGDDMQGAIVRLSDAAGDERIILDAEYGSSGKGRIITDELEITGGSDLSEQFDIESASTEVQPGVVVSIDPDHAGRLCVSTTAYDRRVAGVVSGAGGVRTGMMMGQSGSLADGAHPVALSGRVYVRADVSNGAIKPGDLLTTSGRAGHAMKVIDHDKAHGAVIGKAMTELDDGTGLVLVLVNLQ